MRASVHVLAETGIWLAPPAWRYIHEDDARRLYDEQRGYGTRLIGPWGGVLAEKRGAGAKADLAWRRYDGRA